MTTTRQLLDALIPLVDDLSRELDEGERYRRLLLSLRQLVPADAVALLRLEGEHLVPLAVNGLSTDTLGRRFHLNDHPRLSRLMASSGPLHFSADCELPDPYDGLVLDVQGQLEVHDCLGCPLQLDDRPWGLLTLDALDPQRFTTSDLAILDAFASLAAATVRVSQRMDALTRQAEQEHALAEIYRRQGQRRLIGQSPAHRQLLQEIDTVAGSDLSVLITGETGVGKELVAEAIHAASARQQRPMVSINCAALPEHLAESELFGHVRGAFSGASNERRGRFELADGGTLFLDEVGELPPHMQAKLLRVLQSGQLQRVGSDREHRVDVRIIAATNRNLADEVRQGRFRADLYHRLSVYPLPVPALRERGRDVLLLAGCFLEENRARNGLQALRLTQAAESALLHYGWPGNIRELEHLIGRAALRASQQQQRSRVISIDFPHLDLPMLRIPMDNTSEAMSNAAGPPASLREAIDAFQRQHIRTTLQQHDHNWAAAARSLGIDRANLLRLARRLQLR